MQKISQIKSANTLGLVMLYFLSGCVLDIFQERYFFGLIDLGVSWLYLGLVKKERTKTVYSLSFFQISKLPYYTFLFFFLINIFVCITSPFSTLFTLNTFFSSFLGIYCFLVILKPLKVIKLDVEIYQLFGKILKKD